jgi:alpha-beta hydrolase superfamily lysophospholipase
MRVAKGTGWWGCWGWASGCGLLALGIAATAAWGAPDRDGRIEIPYRDHDWLGRSITETASWYVAQYLPAAPATGDVFYLPGFADGVLNHEPLFREWTRAGFRVVAADLPGQGLSRGEGKRASLDAFTFTELAAAAHQIEQATRETDRPLVLAGWSTGALALVRSLQGQRDAEWSRRPSAVILFAPGVAVRPVVGEPSLRYPIGEVTVATLTHDLDRQLATPIFPRSPGDVLVFAADLLTNSGLSYREGLPSDIPTLVLAAGDETDRYVFSPLVQRWAKALTGPASLIVCPQARHWLDGELDAFGGADVRRAAARYAAAAVAAQTPDLALTVCREAR